MIGHNITDKPIDGGIYSFRDSLYNKVCIGCGKNLGWIADFDADGTNYYASCCNKQYVMIPNSVEIRIYE